MTDCLGRTRGDGVWAEFWGIGRASVYWAVGSQGEFYSTSFVSFTNRLDRKVLSDLSGEPQKFFQWKSTSIFILTLSNSRSSRACTFLTV
jgi:hypothetical protein